MSIPINLMAHLVAGYPTDELAYAAAHGLVEGGCSYIEVQLPFSDPSADGPAIQSACAQVLSRGYTVVPLSPISANSSHRFQSLS